MNNMLKPEKKHKSMSSGIIDNMGDIYFSFFFRVSL